MPSGNPEVVIRIGTHAEKQYLLKTISFLDGVMIGANLLEATPGATSSLLVRFAGKRTPCVPCFIDPMTYAFGSYRDKSGKRRTDLDWIKSERKRKGRKPEWNIKLSYEKLAAQLGEPFSDAIAQESALTWGTFDTPTKIEGVARSVADYQLSRIKSIFAQDPELAGFAGDVPAPAAVLTPYFYIEPEHWRSWTPLMMAMAKATASLSLPVPVHAVLCTDVTMLGEPDFLAMVTSELPGTGVAGVWLWLSRFFEERAAHEQFSSFRSLVAALSARIQVYNLHGGYFSLALSKYGMSRVCHGVGYGEQKDVLPVIGQSTPTVRYYLPTVRRRLGVPDIEACFPRLGIETPRQFHSAVCDCVVCRGVVSGDIGEFSSFGDLHYSTPTSRRRSQTPAAAKRCRFHFLLNRIRERDRIRNSRLEDILSDLDRSVAKWAALRPIRRYAQHLQKWRNALE